MGLGSRMGFSFLTSSEVKSIKFMRGTAFVEKPEEGATGPKVFLFTIGFIFPDAKQRI